MDRTEKVTLRDGSGAQIIEVSEATWDQADQEKAGIDLKTTRPLRYLYFLLPLLLLGIPSSCRNGETARRQAVLEDSAGVKIVRFASLKNLELPQWPTRRLSATSRTAVEFVYVRDALFLPDSSLLVADAGASGLLLLSPNGYLTQRVGRKGEGPGEYSSPSWLALAADSSVWVYDQGLLRMTELGPDLDVRDTWQMDAHRAVSSLRPLTMWSDGRVLVVHSDTRIFPRDTERRDTIPLLVMDRANRVLDTLGHWMGVERWYAARASGVARIPIGFYRNLVADGRSGLAAIGSTDSLDLTVLADGGAPVLRIRATEPPANASSREIELWREVHLQTAPLTTPDFLAVWQQAPVRQTLPAFEDVAIDPTGSVWVGHYLLPSESRRMWTVFAPTGEPLGVVSLPAQFRAQPLATGGLLDLSATRAALLLRNEWDEQRIEIWSVERRR